MATEAELAAMKTGATTLEDLGAQMTSTLSQLRGDVETTRSVWSGEAQVAFTGVMMRWDEDAAKINNALNEISSMLAGNTQQYTQQEATNVQDINKILGMMQI